METTIIVVDAEPVVRSIVTKTLEGAGYVVHGTDDVNTALDLCRMNPPALVLTNVFLPGITGHEALRLFKMHCPGVPVLMVSGLPDSDVIRHWMEEDGFDAFPKPFLPKDLVAKVQESLAGKSKTSPDQ